MWSVPGCMLWTSQLQTSACCLETHGHGHSQSTGAPIHRIQWQHSVSLSKLCTWHETASSLTRDSWPLPPRSIISDYNLQCGKAWLAQLANSAFFLGVQAGGLAGCCSAHAACLDAYDQRRHAGAHGHPIVTQVMRSRCPFQSISLHPPTWAGYLFGSGTFGTLADHHGRRRTLLLASGQTPPC
jgi:hypothetical protein